MIRSTRTLVVLAGLAALAVPSQAVITFSAYTSDFTVGPANQISSTPPHLSGFPQGVGPVTDSGHFDVSSSNGLSALDVNEVDGYAFAGGDVSLTVSLYNGATAGSGILQTLYISSSNDPLTTPFLPDHVNTPFPTPLLGTHYVSYTATFVGSSPVSEGYLGGFAVDAYPAAVPEPAALATLGIGVIGLLARRRRSAK